MFIPHTFKNQWDGLLGDFWYKDARKEVERLYNERDNMIIEEDGAVRWISSGSYLPDDCMEKLEYAPVDLSSKISREATKIKREIQVKESIEEYRKQMENHEYTVEELEEMRNSFGPDTVVVNIFTGKKIRV